MIEMPLRHIRDALDDHYAVMKDVAADYVCNDINNQ